MNSTSVRSQFLELAPVAQQSLVRHLDSLWLAFAAPDDQQTFPGQTVGDLPKILAELPAAFHATGHFVLAQLDQTGEQPTCQRLLVYLQFRVNVVGMLVERAFETA